MKRIKAWWHTRGGRWWSDYQLPIMMILAIAALFLGFIGFTQFEDPKTSYERTPLDNLYLTLGLLSMNSGDFNAPIPWELQVARFLVPAIAAYTAILAFAMVFTQQAQLVKLWFFRDHIIICGLGRKGIRLANLFLDRGDKVVILEVDEGNDWIEAIRSSGAIVLSGDASDPELLRKARIHRAKYLIATLGNDGKNAEVAVQAEMLSSQRDTGVLTCIIHIVDPQLWSLLREKELSISPEAHFRLELFNIFDRGASLLLKMQSNLQGQAQKTPNHNRLMIIGLGSLGQSLVIQASMNWQGQRTDGNERLKFLIIDLNAEQKIKSLYIRYPNLEDISELEPLQMNVNSADFHRAEFLYDGDKFVDFDSIYICMDDDSLGLHTGLALYQKVRDQEIPIVIRMVEDAGLALLLHESETHAKTYKNLHAFPILDQTCTPDLVLRGTHEVIARELHEAYLDGLRENQITAAQPMVLKTWDELAEDAKEWNRKQADRIRVILEKHGYRIAPLRDWKASNLVFNETKDLDEVEAMAQLEHQMWCQEMRKLGWQHGPERSKKQLTNPDLVAWDELPAEEIFKNKNFIRRLPKVLARAGFQIERKNSAAGK